MRNIFNNGNLSSSNIVTLESNKLEEKEQDQYVISSQDLIQKGLHSDREAIECDLSSENSRRRLKMITLERAFDMETLVSRREKGYEYPVDVIFSIIYWNYQRLGMSASGLEYTREIFADKQYDKYKSGIYLKQTLQNRARQDIPLNIATLEQLQAIEIESENIAIRKALATIEANMDNPLLKEKIPVYSSQILKEEKKEKEELKELETVRISKPEPRETKFSDILGEISQLAEKAQERVIAYPPSDEDDLYLKNGMSIIRDYLRSISDLKFCRSMYSWFDIVFEKYSQSTHSAMSKSKILSIMNEARKVTREQIDAKDPILIKIAARITGAAPFVLGGVGMLIKDVFADMIETENPALIHVAIRIIELAPYLLSQDAYKDKYQAPYTADFHKRRHNKLSESSFGNSTMQQL
ncbi:MAG: hypothetical protein L0H53_00520 [Candidatus Nitrosocosmicus sp.]|nr:hypothetical protein [Candidatus Nitrosocosmicus sp.]MDN5866020.1 hypothetical protein [Candidatus Nitrosocosmicus sp.]